MSAWILALVLARAAFAADAIPTSKIAAKKSSPARRLYDLVLTTGYNPPLLPEGVSWERRKVRELQAPNDITVRVFATADAGAPECAVDVVGREGRIAEAEGLGLPVPLHVIDRRCSGRRKDLKLTFSGNAARRMTQAQLDLFFGLMEDCFKHGL